MAANLIPTMSSNTAPSGVASEDSVYTTLAAWKAMNKTNVDNNDCWHSGVGDPHWIKYQFPRRMYSNGYSITARNDVSIQYPRTWTFDGSLNGTIWVTLDTRTSLTFIQAEKKTFTIAKSAGYFYYRLNITLTEASYASIGEWEIFGGAAGGGLGFGNPMIF